MENVYESYSETVYDRRYRIIERGCTTDYNPNLKQVKSSIGTFISMLMTIMLYDDKDVGDGFGFFGQQHPLSLDINVGHQHSKDVTKFEIQSPTFTNRHQL